MATKENRKLDDENDLIQFRASERWEYKEIFFTSDHSYIGSDTKLSYFAHALECVRLIVKRLDEDLPPMDYEGTAPLFLFRHYLELSVKQLAQNIRNQDATDEQSIKAIEKKHPLSFFWNEITEKAPKILGEEIWEELAYRFANSCISEFDQLDEKSERLRYEQLHRKNNTAVAPYVMVNWRILCRNMQHTHDVLEAIDTYLVEH